MGLRFFLRQIAIACRRCKWGKCTRDAELYDAEDFMEPHEEKLRGLLGTAEFYRMQDALHRADETEDFFERLLLQDTVHDWELALHAGEYLALIGPDLLIGDLIVARASRHLGNRSEATVALRKCQELVRRGVLSQMEVNVLLPIIEAEERALLKKTSGTDG